jgi:hypothetical protein
MRSILWAAALFGVCAFGADVSGRWSGTVQFAGNAEKEPGFVQMKQDGAKITGRAGPNEERAFDIKSGAIEGSKLHLELAPANGEGPRRAVMDLTVDGDRLTGELKIETDEGSRTATVDMKRES